MMAQKFFKDDFCSKKFFVSTGIRNNDFLAQVFLPQHLHLCNQCYTLLIAWTLGDLAKVMKMPTAPLPRACTANRVGLQMVHLQPWGTRTIIFFNFFISIDLNSIFRRISKIASDFYSIFKQEAPLRWSLNASLLTETFCSKVVHKSWLASSDLSLTLRHLQPMCIFFAFSTGLRQL